MDTCDNCPMPRRCTSAERCIVYKEGAVELPTIQPTPHPVETTAGMKMTGVLKKVAPKKSASKKKAK